MSMQDSLEVWELQDMAREGIKVSFKGENYDPKSNPTEQNCEE